METLQISVACIPTDRTRPVLDGHVAIEGCTVKPVMGEPEDIFGPALRDGAFDVTEMSMSSHILTTLRGDAKYVGIPIFTSRAFRHSSIFVRTDRGLKTMEDLRGCRIGLPEYQQTAALWVRGIMSDQHGVSPRDVSWVTGGLNGPGHGERIPITLPPEIRMTTLGHDDNLSASLARGDLEAIIAPKPPACLSDGKSPVDLLFPTYWIEEADYARKTEFFPIMHCLALRRNLAEKYPWLSGAIYRAFKVAKDEALKELTLTNVSRVSLPWLTQSVTRAKDILGRRFWSYGFPDNERELQVMMRYAQECGLVSQEMPASCLFDRETLALAD